MKVFLQFFRCVNCFLIVVEQFISKIIWQGTNFSFELKLKVMLKSYCPWQFQLDEAVEEEDFVEAARLKGALDAVAATDTVAEVMKELKVLS